MSFADENSPVQNYRKSPRRSTGKYVKDPSFFTEEAVLNRRDTFEGGSNGLNALLDLSGSDLKVKSTGRRMTANASDMSSLLNGLDDSPASTKSTRSKVSKKTPLSVKISINSSEPSSDISGNTFDISASPVNLNAKNERRMTADVSDIASLLDGLESSPQAQSIQSVSKSSPGSDSVHYSNDSSLNFNMRANDNRRQTADGSALEAIMNHLDDSVASSKKTRPSSASKKSNKGSKPSSRRSSLRSIASQDLDIFDSENNSRRQTVDPADMEAMLIEMEDDEQRVFSSLSSLDISNSSKKSTTKPRRASLRSSAGSRRSSRGSDRRMTADPADMAAMLQGVEDDENATAEYVTESYSMQSPGNTDLGGRESIDTVLLMQSVEDLLGKSTETMKSPKSDVSDLIDLDSSSISVGRYENPHDLEANNSTDSINTMDLMTNIKDALGDKYSNTITMDESTSHTFDFLNQISDQMVSSPVKSNVVIPSSALKGILSTRKDPKKRASIIPSAVKKSVVFGSPNTAEFRKTSPTTSYTPLNKEQARAFFPQHYSAESKRPGDNISDDEEEDEETAANSEILDQWDRLTNASGDSDSDDDQENISSSINGKRGLPLNSYSSKRSRRRRSMSLSPAALSTINSQDNEEDENSYSESADLSAIEPETSFTVGLPGNLMELMAQADGELIENHSESPLMNQSSYSRTDDKTQELEKSLQTMMRHIDYEHHSIVLDNDVSFASSKSVVSSDSSRRSSVPSSVMSSEHSLGPLLGLSYTNNKYESDKENSLEASTISDNSFSTSVNNCSKIYAHDTPSATVELENNLGDVLVQALDLAHSAEDNKYDSSSDSEEFTQHLENDMKDLINRLAADSEDDLYSPAKIPSPAPESPLQPFSQPSTPHEQSSQKSSKLSKPPTPEVESLKKPSPASVKLSQTTIALRDRLKALNRESRQNVLDQCSNTPLPSHKSKSRASVGFSNRQSISTASKPPKSIINQQYSQEDQNKFEEVSMIADVEKLKYDDIIAKATLLSAKDLSDTSLLKSHSFAQQIVAFMGRNIHSMDKTTNSIESIFTEITQAATIEAGTQLQAMISDQILPRHCDKYLSSESCPSLESIDSLIGALRPQAEELVNFNWMLWESRLCDIASDSIKQNSDRLRKEIDALRLSNDALEAEAVAAASKKPSSDSSPKQSLSHVEINKLHEVEELELSLHDSQRLIQLVNRMTYCQVRAMSTRKIDVEAIFSSTCRVSVVFELSAVERSVSNILVDIARIDCNQSEDLLASAYFANVMADDQLAGPLSATVLSAVESISHIPKILRQVSGSISTFKRVCNWINKQAAANECKWAVSGSSVGFYSGNSCVKAFSIRQIIAAL